MYVFSRKLRCSASHPVGTVKHPLRVSRVCPDVSRQAECIATVVFDIEELWRRLCFDRDTLEMLFREEILMLIEICCFADEAGERR